MPFALRTFVDGVTQVDVPWTARDEIPHVVQHTLPSAIPIGAVPAVRTGPPGKVAAAGDDLRLRQVLHPRDALGGIRQILSGSRHGNALRDMAFPSSKGWRVCTKCVGKSMPKPAFLATLSRKAEIIHDEKKNRQPASLRFERQPKTTNRNYANWKASTMRPKILNGVG